MKKIILTADESLIERARAVARSQHKTLDVAFREWLAAYTREGDLGREYDELMQDLRQHVRSSGPYSRDDMNGR